VKKISKDRPTHLLTEFFDDEVILTRLALNDGFWAKIAADAIVVHLRQGATFQLEYDPR
jgi:hypothetical protein